MGVGAVETLIWHASDSAVKPIVANRRIERLPEPKYDPKSLPFTPMLLPVSGGAAWALAWGKGCTGACWGLTCLAKEHAPAGLRQGLFKHCLPLAPLWLCAWACISSVGSPSRKKEG